MLKILNAGLWVFNAAWMWRDYNNANISAGNRLLLALGFIVSVSAALYCFRSACYSGIVIQEFIIEEPEEEENGGVS